MLSYQDLLILLRAEFLTVNKVFNGKKHIPADVLSAIEEHTNFLNYDAPVLTRVSYLLAGETVQRSCIECHNLIVTNTSLSKTSLFCGISCSKKSVITKQKRKDTTLQKYGVENIFQRTDIIQQAVEDKYGVANISKFPATKKKIGEKSKENTRRRLEKTFNTNLQTYGVPHTSQLESVKDKKKSTTLLNYGADHYFKTAEFKERMGVKFAGKNPAQLDSVKEKVKSTKRTKYGDEHYNNTEKAKETMMLKFGCHSSQTHWTENAKNIMSDSAALQDALLGNSINSVADTYGLASTTVRNKAYEMGIVDYNKRINQYESLVEELLNEHSIIYERNNRSILSGKELDFYIPSLNLAIECNGIFWHSELMGKDRKYHLQKTEDCINQGIRLIHIWDYQFDKNSKLVVSMLKAKLGVIKFKIGARNTVVKELPSALYNEFMRNNHIQGSVNSSIRYGLYFDNRLVAAMGFGKSRFAKNEYELLRFSSAVDTVVVGGAGRLLSHFLKNTNIQKLVTYAERDISDGKMYESLGFSLVHITPPSYLYFRGREVYNRLLYQKHKLKDKLNTFDETLTEWQNMVNNGFNRFWNTGDFKYEFSR